jgi:hypothetical protein
MRRYWLLPDEEHFKYTGPDWLLHPLDSVESEVKARVLLILWRAWHLRNDVIHAKGTTTIMSSAMFLSSYGESLHIANQPHVAQIDIKGKGKLKEGVHSGKTTIHRQRKHKRKKATWLAPPSGWVKINTDTAFCQRTGKASVGVVARDQKGVMILSAWRFLRHCGSPEEAEAEACLEGMCLLAVEWIRQHPIYAERDCSGLVAALHGGDESRARWAGVISEIIGLSRLLPACIFKHVGREANNVAHQLARRALEEYEWVVMRHDIPSDLRSLVNAETAGESDSPTRCNINLNH